MKWFSFSYVKRNPWLFVGIVIIFGILFWFLINRGSSSSAGTTVVQSGVSDAQAAMQMQMGMAQMQMQGQMAIAAQQANARLAEAQLGADTTLALAGLEAAFRDRELSVTQQLAQMQTEADLVALDRQLSYQIQSEQSQHQFTVDYASLAYDAASEQIRINAALQAEMGRQQLEAFNLSAMLGALGSLKKKDRDTALGAILATNAGYGFSGGRGDDYISIPGPTYPNNNPNMNNATA